MSSYFVNVKNTIAAAVAVIYAAFAATTGAGLIGWIQPGVGAVIRWVQDKLRESVSVMDFGATGGADDTVSIQKALDAMGANSKLIFPAGYNFKATRLTINAKSDFAIQIDGKLTNIAAKAGAAATDSNTAQRGLNATFYITNCSRFEINGSGSINNGFREAFCIGENLPANTAAPCTDFYISINIQGDGTNDNIHANRIRYCSRFTIANMRVDAVSKKPAYVNNATPYYYDWAESLLLWDCVDFTIRGITSSNGAMNGIYIGSNCDRFTITDNDLQHNGASGLQMAWSSFGSYPTNFTVTNNRADYNRADGYDYNNTGALIECNGIHTGNRSHYNGWATEDTAATTPTNDGSGIGTFINLKKMIVSGNVDKECSRTGGYFVSCYDFAIDKNIINKVSAASLGDGLYFDTCTNMDASRGNNVNVIATRPALKLYSLTGNVNVKVAGNYLNGLIQYAGGTYIDCNFDENKVITTTQVVLPVSAKGNTILVSGASQNGLYAGASGLTFEGNRVTATGFAIMANAFNYINILNNSATGGNGGIRVDTSTGTKVSGNYGSGQGSPGIHLLATTNCELSMNRAESVGSNTLRVESTCITTQKWGNTEISGPGASYLGTFGVNF